MKLKMLAFAMLALTACSNSEAARVASGPSTISTPERFEISTPDQRPHRFDMPDHTAFIDSDGQCYFLVQIDVGDVRVIGTKSHADQECKAKVGELAMRQAQSRAKVPAN